MPEEKILHLLKKKKLFFDAILELSESEPALPLHEWISILEQKRILLSCVEDIDRDLAPYKEKMHHLTDRVSEEIETIREVIKRVLHLDAQHKLQRKKELKPYETEGD